MQYFPGTEIERRIYGKTELAQELGIGRDTMRRYIRRMEYKFEVFEGYNKFSKILFPQQIEILLRHYGWV